MNGKETQGVQGLARFHQENSHSARKMLTQCIYVQCIVWPGGVMAKTLAYDSRGREFNCRPFHYHVTTLARCCSHTCASVTKQYNLVPVVGQRCPMTRTVTVGLASHWPCVTDLSGLSTDGLKA